MKSTHRLVLLSLIAVLVIIVASPALATEDSTEGETTATTVAAEQISEGEGPAIDAPEVEIEEQAQPWTARFIYPVLLVITIVLIGWIVIAYNRKVRHRYEVVS